MAVPGKTSALEIAPADFGAVEEFITSALEGACSIESVRRAMSGAIPTRVMGAWRDDELAMVAPFAIAADGMGQFGAPVASRRALSIAPALVAEIARAIAGLGAAFVHTAVVPGDPLEGTLLSAGLAAGSLMLEMSMEAPKDPPAAPGRWVFYSEDKRPAFAEVFYATLEASVDAVEAPVCRDGVLLMKSFEERGGWTPEDFVLYEWEGRAAAILLVTVSPEAAEIAYLGVSPEYRGRGIARTLGARVLERAAARGARVVRVTVDSRNAAAIAVYRRMGFSERRAVRIYYLPKKIF